MKPIPAIILTTIVPKFPRIRPSLDRPEWEMSPKIEEVPTLIVFNQVQNVGVGNAIEFVMSTKSIIPTVQWSLSITTKKSVYLFTIWLGIVVLLLEESQYFIRRLACFFKEYVKYLLCIPFTHFCVLPFPSPLRPISDSFSSLPFSHKRVWNKHRLGQIRFTDSDSPLPFLEYFVRISQSQMLYHKSEAAIEFKKMQPLPQ